MSESTIVLAGASGNLGLRIARALRVRGATVRALVRGDGPAGPLKQIGATIVPVDFSNAGELAAACSGACCVVSALQGLRDVIVDLQTALLEAAIEVSVPRFIPSDYSADFTKLDEGENRNFDLRREFHRRLDRASIGATTIFNGAFTELLTGPMPLILFKLRRVLYWGSADQAMDFTTMDNVAAFTACAALDPSTPRFLRVAGDQVTARDVAQIASEVDSKRFRLFRAGGLGALKFMIKVTQALTGGEDKLYPPWQGMQYMHNMLSGRAKLEALDNGRYPGIQWTSVGEYLEASRAGR